MSRICCVFFRAVLVTVTAVSAAPVSAQVARPEPLKVADALATTEAEMKPYTEPLEHTTFKLEMVPIRGGRFVIGSPASEADRAEDEGPQHEVQISPFWMSKFEITWNQ